MAISLTEDIRSVTELKRNTRQILDHMHKTGRPVLLDAKTFEKHLKANNMTRLLAPAEEDIAAGRESEMGQFLEEFKHAHGIPSKGYPKSKGGHR